MEYQEYAYYSEVVQQRIECLKEGEKMREDVLIDTIYRLYDMCDFLKERLMHSDTERFTK